MAALAFRRRSRGNSLSTVTPPLNSTEYDPTYAAIATRVLYRSPLPSQNDLPVFILDSAAFPDADDVHYGSLLPYVLARLPTEEQLIGGKGYEVVFFAGGEERGVAQPKKSRPPWPWFLQAYQVLSRAMRKRLQKLYIVHERRWTRVMLEMFSTVISPKFRRKIYHCSTMSALGLHIPIEDLLIPPSAYERDRKLAPDIHVPYATGKRAFGVRNPLPTSKDGNPRLPRVLRETSIFILDEENIKTEGLFRINARAQTLDILREAYDRGQKFIIWKELNRVICSGYWQDGHGEVVVDEASQLDGYGVYTAAGLIKMWYSKQRDPVVREDAYATIEESFGDRGVEETAFLHLIAPSAETSPLPKQSRFILTMHLFPLLARIANHSTENRMTAGNLAVCFAPAMLCGGDPIRDAKVSRILIKIIQYGVENWDIKLAKACEMEGSIFDDLIKRPASAEDREDPLENSSMSSPPRSSHDHGIVMLENDDSESSEELEKPPLPPRILSNSTTMAAEPAPSIAMPSPAHIISPIRRKPAPPPRYPPRYSTIVNTMSEAAPQLPAYQEEEALWDVGIEPNVGSGVNSATSGMGTSPPMKYGRHIESEK